MNSKDIYYIDDYGEKRYPSNFPILYDGELIRLWREDIHASINDLP